jgi:Family of unknown function (DUF5706)
LSGPSGVVAGVISLFGSGHRLADVEPGWTTVVLTVGIALMVIALVCVTLVVRPRPRKPRIEAEKDDQFIFFGHLKDWTPANVQDALEGRDVLPVLSSQIVAMARIAWQKHVLLQSSMSLAIVGTALIAVAAALNGRPRSTARNSSARVSAAGG